MMRKLVAIGLLALGACSGGKSEDRAPAPDPLAGEVVEHTTELGPVTAVVKLAPPNPSLGDPLTLMLEVTAEPQVTVEMPDFGDALGRFAITRFVPRERVEDGKRVATQVYTLQAPMSGKQRIPPLRVEFVDERPEAKDPAAAPNQPAADPNQPAAGDTEPGEIRELLTEEIPITIASLLPEDLSAVELSAPRGNLRVPSPADSLLASAWFWIPVAVLLALAMAFGIRKFLAAARTQRRVSAYAAAMQRLGSLENRGLPEPEAADEWYVELSGIIRRYLEDRYNLRAPELTTEEFLQIARDSGVLSMQHRKLLREFLSRCDRVKFARYAPADDESREALESARSFLEDTRPETLQAELAAAAPGTPSAAASGAAAQDKEAA